jgi:hypothetical protein
MARQTESINPLSLRETLEFLVESNTEILKSLQKTVRLLSPQKRVSSDINENAASGQKLETPLPETGVELDPKSPRDLTVENGIKRVWASLFAKQGGKLSLLSLDQTGRLLTTPDNIGSYEHVTYTTPTVPETGNIDIDLGEVCDYVEIAIPDALLIAAVALKSSDLGTQWRICDTQYFGTITWCRLNIKGRFRHIRLSQINLLSPEATTAYVSAFKRKD